MPGYPNLIADFPPSSAVDRETLAQDCGLLTHLGGNRLIVRRIQHVGDQVSDLLGFDLGKAAGRHGWRANADTGGHKGLLRVVRDTVLIDRDVRTTHLSAATRPVGRHPLKFDSSQPPLADLAAGDYRLMVEASREVGGRELLQIDFQWPPAQAVELSASGERELGALSLKLKP